MELLGGAAAVAVPVAGSPPTPWLLYRDMYGQQLELGGPRVPVDPSRLFVDAHPQFAYYCRDPGCSLEKYAAEKGGWRLFLHSGITWRFVRSDETWAELLASHAQHPSLSPGPAFVEVSLVNCGVFSPYLPGPVNVRAHPADGHLRRWGFELTREHTVAELRQMAAHASGIPVGRLVLVYKGQTVGAEVDDRSLHSLNVPKGADFYLMDGYPEGEAGEVSSEPDFDAGSVELPGTDEDEWMSVQ